MNIFEFIEQNNITDDRVKSIMIGICNPDKSNLGLHYHLLNLVRELISEVREHDVIHEEHVMPEHYTKLTVEPIVFIVENNLSFCQGNVIKYLSRLGKKDNTVDELKKVFFYIDVHFTGNYEITKKEFGK